MLKRMTLAAMLSLGVATGALAAGERHGGTLFFTAPYGSSFATLDVQASPNTQEEFITQAIHRGLYSWNSVENKPVLELAVRRFNAFAKLQSELDEARTALSDRKIIDRAKSILMSQRGLSEPDAYALLRSSAMNQGKKIVDVAQALITASDLLGGM